MTPEQLRALSPDQLYPIYLATWHQDAPAVAAYFGVDTLTAMQLQATIDALMSQYSVDGEGYFYLANVDSAGNVKYFPVGSGPEPYLHGTGGIVSNEPPSTTLVDLTAPSITTAPSGTSPQGTAPEAPLSLGTVLLYAAGGYIALKMLKGL